MIRMTDNVIVEKPLFQPKKKRRPGASMTKNPKPKTIRNRKAKEKHKRQAVSVQGLPYADKISEYRRRMEEKYG